MKKIWILTLGMFALGMDTYIVAGLLPDMGRTFNKSSAEIGQGVTVFTLFFALSAPIFSTILAKHSVKKTLLIALLTFGIANVITMLSMNYTMYILSRCIAGLGAGLFSPMAVSSGGHLVDRKHKGKALAFIVGGMSVGTVVGVPVGLQLANLLNWRWTIGVIVIISIIAFISIFVLLPNFKLPATPSLKERFSLFVNPHVLRVVSVTVCAAIASLGLYTYLSQVINEYLSPGYISLFLTAWGIGGLIGSFGVGFIIDKFKDTKHLMLTILIILALSILFIPILIKVPYLSVVPFILWGAMGWATQAPQQHILLKNHAKHGSASVALNSSINYLGSALGAALGGVLLANGLNINVLIYSAFAVVVLGILIQLLNIFIDKGRI
ncbi:MFS transporter [Staphylococcus xylosus]|uniref:MFS transporter n=1 Tax=Staphylococcus xylosus TaxID=1288 RepID=UPI001CDC7FE6|nr:MFS transporter [Staphylococcus xylosus]MCA2503993.1 MFS transporter [Staphylococcus xylosus]MCQ3820662.1 MFS transporter [Staphylococcus xylosus]